MLLPTKGKQSGFKLPQLFTYIGYGDKLPIVCWHWLGSQSTDMICRNMCIDSVHPNWIDKHGR